MITQMYSVRDSAAEAFLPPFFMRARGEAMRSFVQACADEKMSFCKHPEHFALYLLGAFNDEDGVITPLERPQHVLNAIDAVRMSKPVPME